MTAKCGKGSVPHKIELVFVGNKYLKCTFCPLRSSLPVAPYHAERGVFSSLKYCMLDGGSDLDIVCYTQKKKSSDGKRHPCLPACLTSSSSSSTAFPLPDGRIRMPPPPRRKNSFYPATECPNRLTSWLPVHSDHAVREFFWWSDPCLHSCLVSCLGFYSNPGALCEI